MRCILLCVVSVSLVALAFHPLRCGAASIDQEPAVMRLGLQTVVWNSSIPLGTHGNNRPESANPLAASALDDNNYYVVNRNRQLNAYNRRTGAREWQVLGSHVFPLPAISMLVVEYEGLTKGIHVSNGSTAWTMPNTQIIHAYSDSGRYVVFNNVTALDQFFFTMIDGTTGAVVWIANITGGVTSPPDVCSPGISIAQSDNLANLGTYGIDLSNGQPLWLNMDVYGNYLGCAQTRQGPVAFLTNTVQGYLDTVAIINAATGALLFNITGEFAKRIQHDDDVFTQSHYLCTETSTKYAVPSETVLQCWDATTGSVAWSKNITGILAQNGCQPAFPFEEDTVIFACEAFSGATTNISAFRVSDGALLWTRDDIPQSGRNPGVFEVADYVWVRSDGGFTAVNEHHSFSVPNGAHNLRQTSIQVDRKQRSVYFATETDAMRLDY